MGELEYVCLKFYLVKLIWGNLQDKERCLILLGACAPNVCLDHKGIHVRSNSISNLTSRTHNM